MNNAENQRKVERHLHGLANLNHILEDAFKLKIKMISFIKWASLGFCLTKTCDFVLVNLLVAKHEKARAHCALQALDFLWICSVLLVCRSRKHWPAYFTLPINDESIQFAG